MNRIIQKIYHHILRFFFDYDVSVYSLKNNEVKVNSFLSYKYFRTRISNLLAKKPNIKKKNFKTKVKIQNYAIIDSSLVLRKYPLDFLENLLIKDIWLDFFAICKNYLVLLKEKMSKVTDIILNFYPYINKIPKRDLILSKRATTEKEIIEIEPYSNILPVDKLVGISVEKEPIDITVFNKKQLETMREKLAISAKCKKYSIKVENIYGDFCGSLYSKAEMQKDNKVIYKFRTDFVPENEEEQMYMFVTGKKRYDTEKYSTIVAYKDLEI